jgi:hypothetical protein
MRDTVEPSLTFTVLSDHKKEIDYLESCLGNDDDKNYPTHREGGHVSDLRLSSFLSQYKLRGHIIEGIDLVIDEHICKMMKLTSTLVNMEEFRLDLDRQTLYYQNQVREKRFVEQCRLPFYISTIWHVLMIAQRGTLAGINLKDVLVAKEMCFKAKESKAEDYKTPSVHTDVLGQFKGAGPTYVRTLLEKAEVRGGKFKGQSLKHVKETVINYIGPNIYRWEYNP